MMWLRLALLITPVLVGCKSMGAKELGQGPELDGRLVADVYTWQCDDRESGTLYEGVFAFEVALEFAPDALPSWALPAPGGCSLGVSMFSQDSALEGTDIPGVGSPKYSTDYGSGTLERVSPGFYFDEVFRQQHTCMRAEDILASGVGLTSAGVISGASTPPPGEAGELTMSVDLSEMTSIPWGEVVQIDWTLAEWDTSWVQLRRERGDEAYETVTCNTTGLSSFTVDADVWDLATQDLPVDRNNLYVGFQNEDVEEMTDGQKVEVLTRSIHVAVVR